MAEEPTAGAKDNGCAHGTVGLGCVASFFGIGLGLLGITFGALATSNLWDSLLFLGATTLSLVVGMGCLMLSARLKAGDDRAARATLIVVLVSALAMWALTWGTLGLELILTAISGGGGFHAGQLIFGAPPLGFPPAVTAAAAYTLMQWKRQGRRGEG